MQGNSVHLDGATLIDSVEAGQKAQRYIAASDKGVRWGGVTISSDSVVKNFMFAGQIESGKTLSLKMLMHQALVHVGTKEDWRGIVYDDKGDLTPFVNRLGCPVEMLNPFHKDGVGWKMCEDIQEPAHVDSIVSMFIPENEGEGSGKFFSEAGRQLMEGVMKGFLLTDIERRLESKSLTLWSLRDVCLALQQVDYMKQLFGKYKPLAQYADVLNRTNNDVLLTIRAFLKPFNIIAALWHGRETFSIKAWRDEKKSRVLILGSDPERDVQIQAINRVLLGRVMQLLLKQEDSKTRRVWFFLDEFSNIGRLEGFDGFITKARSKGCVVSIAFQNFSGVIAEYGEELASKIITECGHKAFLKGDGPYAKWVSEYIGNKRVKELVRSESESGGLHPWDRVESRQIGLSEQINEIPVLRPDDLSDLHKVGISFGLSGYYSSTEVGKDIWLNSYKPEQLKGIAQVTSSYKAWDDRDPIDQILQPWNTTDLQRLGLKEITPSAEPDKSVSLRLLST